MILGNVSALQFAKWCQRGPSRRNAWSPTPITTVHLVLPPHHPLFSRNNEDISIQICTIGSMFLFSKVTLPLNKFQGFKRKNTTERKTVSNQPESPNNLTKHTLLRSSSAKAACLVTWLPGQNTSGEIHIAATCDHLPSAAFSSFRMVNKHPDTRSSNFLNNLFHPEIFRYVYTVLLQQFQYNIGSCLKQTCLAWKVSAKIWEVISLRSWSPTDSETIRLDSETIRSDSETMIRKL